MNRYYVKSAEFGSQNYHVMDSKELNEFGENVCLVSHETYAKANEICQDLNAERTTPDNPYGQAQQPQPVQAAQESELAAAQARIANLEATVEGLKRVMRQVAHSIGNVTENVNPVKRDDLRAIASGIRAALQEQPAPAEAQSAVTLEPDSRLTTVEVSIYQPEDRDYWVAFLYMWTNNGGLQQTALNPLGITADSYDQALEKAHLFMTATALKVSDMLGLGE